MGEIWVAAAITVGGGVISGIGQEKKDKSDKKFSKEQTEEGYRKTAQQTGYESALEDFYNEKSRYNKQRGLDQYRQFSTMKDFAPDVNDQGGRVAEPVMPKYNDFAPTTPTATAAQSSGGKSGGLLSKIDPIGSKIFGGLF